MPDPALLDAVDDPLIQAYRAAWLRVTAEQQAIADDPAQFRRQSRLREVERSIRGVMDEIDDGVEFIIKNTLPNAYAAGATAETGGVGEMVWTQIHQEAVQDLAQGLFKDLLEATQGVRDSTKDLIRTVARDEALQSAIEGKTAVQAGSIMQRIIEEHGIHAVTYVDGSRHGLAEYSQMAMRTKTATAYNTGTLNQHEDVGFFEVFDGPECGWSFHEDPTLANGLVVTRDESFEFIISHPQCRRSFGPRPDVTSKKQAKELAKNPDTVGSGQTTLGQREAQLEQDRGRKALQQRRAQRQRKAQTQASKSSATAEPSPAEVKRITRKIDREVKTGELSLPSPLPPDFAPSEVLTTDGLTHAQKSGIGAKKGNAKKKATLEGKSQAEIDKAVFEAEQKAIAQIKGVEVPKVGVFETVAPPPKIPIEIAEIDGQQYVTAVYFKVDDVPTPGQLLDAGIDPAQVAGVHSKLLEDAAGIEGVEIKAKTEIKTGLGDVADALKADGDLPTGAQPVALYDASSVGAPGPGATGRWETRLIEDTGSGVYIPVRDLEINGHTVKEGLAVRRNGRTYVAEKGSAQSLDELKAELEHHVGVVEGTLQTVPDEFRGLQKGVAFLKSANPSDAHWAAQYNMPGFTSAATGAHGRTIFWNTDPRPGTILHEFGHTLDSSMGKGGAEYWSDANWTTSSIKDAKQAETVWAHEAKVSEAHKDLGFTSSVHGGHEITPGVQGVTTYGAASVHEDFAESFRLYMQDQYLGYIGYTQMNGKQVSVRFADVFPERAQAIDRMLGKAKPLEKDVFAHYDSAAGKLVKAKPGTPRGYVEKVHNTLYQAEARVKVKQIAHDAIFDADGDPNTILLPGFTDNLIKATGWNPTYDLNAPSGVNWFDVMKEARDSALVDLEKAKAAAKAASAAKAEQEAAATKALIESLSPKALSVKNGKLVTDQLSNPDKVGVGVIKGNAKKKALAEGKSVAEVEQAVFEAEQKAIAKKLGMSSDELAKILGDTGGPQLPKLTAKDLPNKDKVGIGVKKANLKKKLEGEGVPPGEIAQAVQDLEAQEIAVRLDRLQLERGTFAQARTTALTDADMSPAFKPKERKAGEDWLKEAGTGRHPNAKVDSPGFGSVSNRDQQAKANIAAELAQRMNNEPDWLLLQRYLDANPPADAYFQGMIDELAHPGGFKSLSPGDRARLRAYNLNTRRALGFNELDEEARQSILDLVSADLVHQWAISSGDGAPIPLAMQKAIGEEFGLKVPYAVRNAPQSTIDQVEAMYTESGPLLRRFVRHMYEHTQAELEEAGIDRVSMYRGMSFPLHNTPDWATDGAHRPALQPANSWSVNKSISKRFGSTMFSASIPRERILGTARTGTGCLSEWEFVVLDSDGLATVVQPG